MDTAHSIHAASRGWENSLRAWHPKQMTFLPQAESGGEGRALPAAYSLARTCQPWVEKPGADPLGRLLGSQPPPSSLFLSSSYFISSTGTSPPASCLSPQPHPHLHPPCATPPSLRLLKASWCLCGRAHRPSPLYGFRFSLKLFLNLYQLPGSQSLLVQPFAHFHCHICMGRGETRDRGWRVRQGTHL